MNQPTLDLPQLGTLINLADTYRRKREVNTELTIAGCKVRVILFPYKSECFHVPTGEVEVRVHFVTPQPQHLSARWMTSFAAQLGLVRCTAAEQLPQSHIWHIRGRWATLADAA